MSNLANITLRAKTSPRVTREGVLWSLVVCCAYASFLRFRPMYQDYDSIPFTWSQLQWHKAAILIPWLVIGVAYAKYRLHHCHPRN